MSAPAARVLRGHETDEAHERGGPSKASPVADLGLQGEGTEGGHPPVGGEATDRSGEGLTIGPDPKVGLDRRELRITTHYDRAVVIEGRLQCRLGEAQRREPGLVLDGPVRSAPPDNRVAEEELRQPIASPREVLDHVATRPGEVADGLLERRRDANRHELARPVKSRQSPTVAGVGLHLVAGRLRDHRGRDDLAGHTERLEQAGEVIAGGAGFIASPDETGLFEPGDQPADRLRVVEDLLDVGTLIARVEDPDRDRVLVDIHPEMDDIAVNKTDNWHDRLPPYVGSARHGG